MAFFNENLILLKVLLFTFYGAFGCLMPFLTVHMTSIGLNIKQITWINSALPLTSLVGPPLVGMLADRVGRYRLITVICMLLSASLHTALLFVPRYTETEIPLIVNCRPEGALLSISTCREACFDPADYVVLQFNISGCKVSCDQPQELGKGVGEPTVEQHQWPVLCKNQKKNQECQIFNEEESMEFNATLSLRKSQGDYTCQYPIQNFSINNSEYTSLTCSRLSPHCNVSCNASLMENMNSQLKNPGCKIVEGNLELTMWLYFAVRAMAEMMSAILVSLLEAVALTMVHQHKGDYGREKMCGLIAVGIFSPLAGYLMDKKVLTFGDYNYAPAFYVFDGLMLVTAVVTLALPIEVQVQRRSLMNNISQLMRTTELCVLLFLMTLLGTFWGYIKTFLYIYLSFLEASWLLIGLTVTVGIIPSLPFLYKSAAVVQYCGHHYLIMLAFLGYCIRFTGLSYISDPWWALLLESLELFTLNLMNVSAATLAYKLAPKSFVATAQALVWVSHFNIGRCLGTFIGGSVLGKYSDTREGNVLVFQSLAVAAAVCAAVYLAIHQFVKSRNSKRSIEPKPQPARENGNIPNGHYTPLQVADERF
ncbi:major facilitator superfamily domain-containing protein 6-A-like [Palaemon carinicauda]|uniref:major facilitator superfamily domain-containing protein 6-A-like n=1 Tax=Palaemon carinicauda TaxID=392227 RepID=UPI0035B6644A